MSMLRDFLAQLLNELLTEVCIHRNVSKRSANVYFHRLPPGYRIACWRKYIQNIDSYAGGCGNPGEAQEKFWAVIK
jgi:hypothetical protein